MSPEKAIAIIKMGEQARWRSGVTIEEEKEAFVMAIEALKGQRPHGEWVLDKEFSFVLNIYECSKCRFNGSKRWHFCPNCGADMRKEGGEK